MPRSGINGTYSLPPGVGTYVPGNTIQSAPENSGMQDVAQTFNTATPVAYGGTGVEDGKPLDGTFGIRNTTDLTKLGVFTAAGIPTATTVTYSLPPASGTLALTSDFGGAKARAATTANITIATALNVGDVIDGVTLDDGDLVLVKNQTAPAENGLYVAGVTPARESRFNTWLSFLATTFTVAEGTVNSVTSWASATPKAGTLGTTAITLRATTELWEPITRVSFSNVASQPFIDLSAYVMWRLTGYVLPLTNGVTIRLRTSSNNGSSYSSGGSDYTFQYDRGTAATADAGTSPVDSALIAPFTVGNTAGYMATLNVSSYAFNKAQAGYVLTTGGGIDGSGGRGVGDVLNTVNLTTARDAFQVFASSGNISGFLMLEGVRG